MQEIIGGVRAFREELDTILAATGPGSVETLPGETAAPEPVASVLRAAGLLENWPGGYFIRATPPPGDFDRPTMRAYSTKARPHIVNPKKPTHTLCGKRTDWWMMAASELREWPELGFKEHGCANCARIAGRLGLD